MAVIKLVGADVPNVTQPAVIEPDVPLKPEDGSQPAFDMATRAQEQTLNTMSSVLENSSRVISRAQQEGDQTYTVMAQAEGQYQQARERNTQVQRQGGITELGETVVRFLELDQKRRASEAKAQQEAMDAEAEAKVVQFIAETRGTVRAGTSSVSQASRDFEGLLGQYRVSPDQKARLYSQFFSELGRVNEEQAKERQDQLGKLHDQRREQLANRFLIDTAGLTSAISKSMTQETLDANREALYKRMDEVAKADIPELDRLIVYNDILKALQPHLAKGYDQINDVFNRAQNYASATQEAAQAQAKFLASNQNDTGTRLAYQQELQFIRVKYGLSGNDLSVYEANAALEDTVRRLQLRNDGNSEIDEQTKREQENLAREYDTIYIGGLAVETLKNPDFIFSLPEPLQKRVKVATELYKEKVKLIRDANEQNLRLTEAANNTAESYARLMLSQLPRGNEQSLSDFLSKYQMTSLPAEIKKELASLQQGQDLTQGQRDSLMQYLRQTHAQRIEILRSQQEQNNRRVSDINRELAAYGLENGTQSFDTERFKQSQERLRQLQRQRLQRTQEQIQGGASPGFRVPPALTRGVVGGKASVLPFRPQDSSKVVSASNNHREDRGTHLHAGVDLAVEAGTPLIAYMPMEVVAIEYEADGYGHYVTARGADGKYHRFAHLIRRPSIRVGQQLQSGDVLGQVGSTGRSSGSHLHWEIRDRNDYGVEGTYNPYVVMQAYSPGGTYGLRGKDSEQFRVSSTQPPSQKRAAIPKNAVPVEGGYLLNGVYIPYEGTPPRVRQPRTSNDLTQVPGNAGGDTKPVVGKGRATPPKPQTQGKLIDVGLPYPVYKTLGGYTVDGYVVTDAEVKRQTIPGDPQGAALERARQAAIMGGRKKASVSSSGKSGLNIDYDLIKELHRPTPVLERRVNYTPAKPLRQSGIAQTREEYKAANNPDANYGYTVLAKDASFRKELHNVANRLGIPAMWLADVMAFETGGSFDPRKPNNQGHYGLIQFDESSARSLGTSISALVGMTRTEQLKYVEAYIRQRTRDGKDLDSPYHVLAAIWQGNSLPSTMQRLWTRGNTDGNITWHEYANRLGSHAGRRYNSPADRRSRIQSRLTNQHPALIASNTDATVELFS